MPEELELPLQLHFTALLLHFAETETLDFIGFYRISVGSCIKRRGGQTPPLVALTRDHELPSHLRHGFAA